MTKEQIKEIIKQALIDKYGEIDNYGSYCGKGNWLSTETVLTTICDAIDEAD